MNQQTNMGQKDNSSPHLYVSEPSAVYQRSSRIQALRYNTSKSIGASCNTYIVEDNIQSIAYGLAWGTEVLAYQGAPSWDLSKLRPKGSKLGSKGTSSGAVSFGRMYDAIVSQMRREEKKNGAGVLGLDYSHPELEDFIKEPFKAAYKIVYLPMHDTPEATALLADHELVKLLSKAYDEFNCFLVKRPFKLDNGTELVINLCTEVEIPHKGYCVLGAINLSLFTPYNLHMVGSYFKLAAKDLCTAVAEVGRAVLGSEFLVNKSIDERDNKQFGLGIYGFSSWLGANGITYREFNDALVFFGVDLGLSIDKLAYNVNRSPLDTLARKFAAALINGYAEATVVAKENGMRAAFCIQPTVSTAQRSLDAFGYAVSSEIQPVNGLGYEDGVYVLRKSAMKGDVTEKLHPKTWTLDNVPYNDYAYTSSLFQQLLDSTGVAHRHSHCFYGKEFDTEDFNDFYTGKNRFRKSLYYRLPSSTNNESLRKAELWQTVEEGELFDGDVNCQLFGEIECECTM